MALAFQVTTPDRVFAAGYGEKVISALWDRFGVRYSPDDRPRLWSKEVEPSWLTLLQERAREALDEAPQLAACDPYQTVYLPIEVPAQMIAVGGESLVVGSLPELQRELEALGKKLQWPTDPDSVRATAARSAPTGVKAAYLELARLVDDGLVQDLPLWVVET